MKENSIFYPAHSKVHLKRTFLETALFWGVKPPHKRGKYIRTPKTFAWPFAQTFRGKKPYPLSKSKKKMLLSLALGHPPMI
jgi:hypothetical protein